MKEQGNEKSTEQISEVPDCCKTNESDSKDNGKKGILSGIFYGLVPHAGCIAFIVFAVLGVTAATSIFKPLLLNPYFFYGLVALSFIFATISAMFYLKKHSLLSSSGVRKKWKYLSMLYGTTILINVALFAVVFPYTANLLSKATLTADAIASQNIPESKLSQAEFSIISLQVSIPCSGHAPLISSELYKITGVENVKFKLPNIFDVSYNPELTSEQKILAADIFKTYKATVAN